MKILSLLICPICNKPMFVSHPFCNKFIKKMKKSKMSGDFKIGSLTMKVHVLEDGTPIIEQQSLIDFLSWLEKGEMIDTPEVKKQIEEFAKFCKSK